MPLYPHSKKTDSSNLQVKIAIRIESLSLIEKKEINVLDAFGGDGDVWNGVQARMKDRVIKVLRIDKKKDLKGVYLRGDNIKHLKSLNLAKYDIIDLDAYGSPFNQLEVLFNRQYKGMVHCTFIMKGMSNVNYALLMKLGYTERMIKKAPVMFSRQPFSKMLGYLSLNGVMEVNNRPLSNGAKNYFYFNLEPVRK